MTPQHIVSTKSLFGDCMGYIESLPGFAGIYMESPPDGVYILVEYASCREGIQSDVRGVQISYTPR